MARAEPCWSRRGGPSSGTRSPSVEDWRALKAILVEHCTAVGRDPAEIDCSVNVMVPSDGDLAPVVAKIDAYREAGADVAILNLPHGAPVELLDELVDAVTPLAHRAQ